MSEKNPLLTSTEALRHQAEERLQVQSALGRSTKHASDPHRALHELQVYQIELEAQNKLLQEALAQAEIGQRLVDFIDSVPVALLSVESDSTILFHNPAVASLLGGNARSRLKGRRLSSYMADDSAAGFVAFLVRASSADGISHCELALPGKGKSRPREVRVEAMFDRQSRTCNLALIDITEQKRMHERVQRLAVHDALTDLPNRHLLGDRLAHAMAAGQRDGRYGAVMFLDLDNLKVLNDTHGHEAGDALLIEVARRLNKCVRGTDTVARFGGDEFVVVVSKLEAAEAESISEANRIAEKIRIALSKPYTLTIAHRNKPTLTAHFRCTVSIGMALFLGHESNPKDLLECADAAMYQAKEAGGNRICFHAS